MKLNRFFRKWLFFNRAYLHKPAWDTGVTPPELIAYIQQHPPGKALELGCGSGLNCVYLANHAWVVDGVDFSPLAILKARRRVRKSGWDAQLMVGDVTKLGSLSLRPPYDLILDIGCLHSIGDELAARAYADCIPVLLKPGGDFLLYAHEPVTTNGSYPDHGLSPEWVNKLFSPALKLIQHSAGSDKTRRSNWYFLKKLP